MPLKLNSSGGGAVTFDVPSTASTYTLTAPAVNDTLVTKTSTDTLTNKTLTSPTINGMSSSILTQMTAVTLTNQTSVDFTGIPSWAKRITLMLSGVSTSSTGLMRFRSGTSGGLATSGYRGAVGGGSTTNFSVGFDSAGDNGAAYLRSGAIQFYYSGSGNTWCCLGAYALEANAFVYTFQGAVTLSGVLDRVSMTTTSTDFFDAGVVNLMYE